MFLDVGCNAFSMRRAELLLPFESLRAGLKMKKVG